MHYPTTLALILGLVAAEPPRVEVVETPGGGVQPQAVVDAQGVIHLVFLRGPADAADVYYSSRKPGGSAFEAPVRVNSEAGSAIALGTVRGPRIAVGRGGRVHLAWNGTMGAKPANPAGGSPMLYARSDAKGGFEPQRNLMARTTGLDGGGSIAADGEGRVYVAWHGQAKGSVGEANRRMWVARSADDGATFSTEEPATDRPTGACGCCGMGALADPSGSVYLLYRGAGAGGSERGMVLLTSRDKGGHFGARDLDAWRINACPMSTASLVEGGGGVRAAWENRGQVAFARVDREPASPTSPSGEAGSRKHPSLAVNRRGEALLAWAEGTAWQEGGSLAWQAFDPSGREVGPRGKAEGAVPAWGLATVVARPDGGFTILR